MVTCPICGRETAEGAFCMRCGKEMGPVAPIAAAVEPTATPSQEFQRPELKPPEFHRVAECRHSESQTQSFAADCIYAAEERIDRETSDAAMTARQSGGPTFEFDRLCVLFEGLPGNVRMRFNPNSTGAGLRNVKISFQSMLTGETIKLPTICKANMMRPLLAQFPAQTPGHQAWQVRVEYEADRRKKTLEGQMEILVIRPEEARHVASNLSISIDNSVRIGDHSANAADITTRGSLLGNHSANTSDIRMRNNLAEALENLAKSQNPFDELRSLIQSDKRSWVRIELFDADAVDPLPPMPANARTDSIVLDIGGRLIHFFANRMVKFGRKRECNDFVIRPPATLSESQDAPYRRISREHCYFEHSGTNVLISDGCRDTNGVLRPSSAGTFWNNLQISRPVEIPAGTTGLISFGDVTHGGALKMELKACDSAKACAACPIADRSWSGDGSRPCLMLSRTDGVAEKFVGLWSCFWLGEADPSFEGYVVFRKDGAFAYCRDDGRTGWLVPGTAIHTDFVNMTIN